MQCDLCECWFHSLCENMSSKLYKCFSSLAKCVPSMLYFCNHNKCYLRLKRIVGEFLKSSADESGKLSDLIENTLQRNDKFLVSTLSGHIEKWIEDVGETIKNLLSSQCGLQEEVESFSKLLQDSSVPSTGVTPVPAQVCTTIADELAERERRKRNVVIYNLPEAKDREADKFLLCP